MSKVVFETIGNTIMFILFALFFTEGLVVVGSEDGVSITANYLVGVFLGYMLLYGIILVIWNKKQGAPFLHLISGLQLHLDTDERESVVSLKAAKVAYFTTICVLPLSLIAFFVIHSSNFSFTLNVNMFVVGCWLTVLSCIIINISYSIAWCIEDAK